MTKTVHFCPPTFTATFTMTIIYQTKIRNYVFEETRYKELTKKQLDDLLQRKAKRNLPIDIEIIKQRDL